MTATRQEHIRWSKERALQELESGNLAAAYASISSDLSKHPETENHVAITLGMRMLMAGLLSDVAEMRKFIEGIN